MHPNERTVLPSCGLRRFGPLFKNLSDAGEGDTDATETFDPDPTPDPTCTGKKYDVRTHPHSDVSHLAFVKSALLLPSVALSSCCVLGPFPLRLYFFVKPGLQNKGKPKQKGPVSARAVRGRANTARNSETALLKLRRFCCHELNRHCGGGGGGGGGGGWWWWECGLENAHQRHAGRHERPEIHCRNAL